ncbi:uncharacterized protein LOC133409746 isoform X2 [Phycodurus eques]|uniref:uncharacterized protein LOC133409746 isoform X2 n=1 Tax=Phycodurus eques TaxID=693459 RepID=UPI002ACE8252|nr:uncharacterized protein LOC133409746 isoform X2 [Phycodurus eques]
MRTELCCVMTGKWQAAIFFPFRCAGFPELGFSGGSWACWSLSQLTLDEKPRDPILVASQGKRRDGMVAHGLSTCHDKRDDSATMPVSVEISEPENEMEVQSTPAPNTPVESRQTAKCANCKRWQKSLRELKQKHLAMRKAKMIELRNIRAKQMSVLEKVLNQKVPRKNEQINQLKGKLDSSEVGEYVGGLKSEILTQKKRHFALKRWHKLKKRENVAFEEESAERREQCEEYIAGNCKDK